MGSVRGLHGDYKALVVQGEWIMAAWSDFREGNGDIYFSRSRHARTGTLPRQTFARRWNPRTDPPRDRVDAPEQLTPYISTRPPTQPDR